jgi:hypothetical protein
MDRKIYRAYYIKQEDYEKHYDKIMERKDELTLVFQIGAMHLQVMTEHMDHNQIQCVMGDCDHTFCKGYMPQALIILMPQDHDSDDDTIVGAICEECCIRNDLRACIIHYLQELTRRENISWSTDVEEFGIKPRYH